MARKTDEFSRSNTYLKNCELGLYVIALTLYNPLFAFARSLDIEIDLKHDTEQSDR